MNVAIFVAVLVAYANGAFAGAGLIPMWVACGINVGLMGGLMLLHFRSRTS